MKTVLLIDRLSKDVKPVSPLPTVFIRMSYVMAAMVIGISLTALLFKFCPDIHEAASQRQFVFSAALLILGWIVESYSLASLALPTRDSKKFLVSGLAIIGLLALSYVLLEVSSGTATSLREGLEVQGVRCSLDITFLSLLPGLFLFLILRRGATTHLVWMGANIGVCCSLLGAFGLQYFCPGRHPIHLLTWHLLVPLILLSGLGALVSKRVLKW